MYSALFRLVLLLLLFHSVPGVSLSLTLHSATICIGDNTTVSWRRSQNDPSGFKLFVQVNNDDYVDVESVDTPLLTGTTFMVLNDSWTPGNYTLGAQFWSHPTGVDASVNFELIPEDGATTTQSKANTVNGNLTATSTSSNVVSTSSISLPGATSSGPQSGNSPTAESTTSSRSKLPVILGGLLGIAVLLLIVLSGILFLRYRRQRRLSRDHGQDQNPASEHTYTSISPFLEPSSSSFPIAEKSPSHGAFPTNSADTSLIQCPPPAYSLSGTTATIMSPLSKSRYTATTYC